MDRFATRMIARGPTLAPDRETWRGSLHVVDLPDAAAAREFVAEEPLERAGLFAAHLVRGFRDRLGRAMGDGGGGGSSPLFLVVAPHALAGVPDDDLLLHGDLLTPDDAALAGGALVARADSRETLLAQLGAAHAVEVHDWERGGRR